MLGIVCYAVAAVWFYLTLRHTPLPEEAVRTPAVGKDAEPERIAMVPERAS